MFLYVNMYHIIFHIILIYQNNEQTVMNEQ